MNIIDEARRRGYPEAAIADACWSRFCLSWQAVAIASDLTSIHPMEAVGELIALVAALSARVALIERSL